MKQWSLGTQVFLAGAFGALVGLLFVFTFERPPIWAYATGVLLGVVCGNLVYKPKEILRAALEFIIKVSIVAAIVLFGILCVATFASGYAVIGYSFAFTLGLHPAVWAVGAAGASAGAVLIYGYAFETAREKRSIVALPFGRRLVQTQRHLDWLADKPKVNDENTSAATPAMPESAWTEDALKGLKILWRCFIWPFKGTGIALVLIADAASTLFLQLGSQERVAIAFGAAAGAVTGFLLRAITPLPPQAIVLVGALAGGFLGRGLHMLHDFVAAHSVELPTYVAS